MTSNQLYSGMNKRFERRAALLRRCGFTYSQAIPGVAVFSRKRTADRFRSQVIAAAEVLHARNDVWIDVLKAHLVH